MNGSELVVWVLLAVAHPGKPALQPEQFFGVYKTQAACEHMLAALSDPAYDLPNSKPKHMFCRKEDVPN